MATPDASASAFARPGLMMLCDSNILIYAADPNDTRCEPFLLRDDACLASVSRIEVLGFPGWGNLPEERRARLQAIVGSMPELQLDEKVIQGAIVLRQQKEDERGRLDRRGDRDCT